MTYTVGRNKIEKHCYHVFMRKNNSALGLSTNQLASACGLDEDNISFDETIALDDTSVPGDVDTSNSLYTLDSSNGSIFLNLTAVTGVGAENDTAFFKVIGFSNLILLAVTFVELNVTIPLGAVGDMISVKFDDAGEIVALSTLSSAAAGNFALFQEIGYTDESPSIKISQGETKQLEKGNILSTSENLEFEAFDLQVSKNNFEALRALCKNHNVDVYFYDENAPEDSFFAYDLILKVNLEVEGTEINKVALSANREIADSDNNIEFIG